MSIPSRPSGFGSRVTHLPTNEEMEMGFKTQNHDLWMKWVVSEGLSGRNSLDWL